MMLAGTSEQKLAKHRSPCPDNREAACIEPRKGEGRGDHGPSLALVRGSTYRCEHSHMAEVSACRPWLECRICGICGRQGEPDYPPDHARPQLLWRQNHREIVRSLGLGHSRSASGPKQKAFFPFQRASSASDFAHSVKDSQTQDY